MTRTPFLVSFLAIAACGAQSAPVESTATSPQLFRGAGSEVRLRCGSETLRARLREGQILAKVGEGESAVLVPVADPRARSGPAYSNGRLTLYKAPGSEAWALASGANSGVACTRDSAP